MRKANKMEQNEPLKVIAELGEDAKYLACLPHDTYDLAIQNPEHFKKVLGATKYIAKHFLGLESQEAYDYIVSVLPNQMYNAMFQTKGHSATPI